MSWSFANCGLLAPIETTARSLFQQLLNNWWARKDLNLEPTDYESAALTVELRAPQS